MARFYFHLKYGDELVADEEGSNLPDLSAARKEALLSARELLASAIKMGNPNIPEAVVVTDESGRVVDSLRLAAVLPQTLRAVILREQ
jgi:hypothetical protein